MLYNLKFEIIKQYTTQRRFAKKVRELEPVVSRVINGHENIDEKKKRRWAKALHCRVEDIFC